MRTDVLDCAAQSRCCLPVMTLSLAGASAHRKAVKEFWLPKEKPASTIERRALLKWLSYQPQLWAKGVGLALFFAFFLLALVLLGGFVSDFFT